MSNIKILIILLISLINISRGESNENKTTELSSNVTNKISEVVDIVDDRILPPNFPEPCINNCVYPQASTESGTIEGVFSKSGVSAFKGIPYAEPPINELRYRSPRKKQIWENTVRNTKEFSASCMNVPGIISFIIADHSNGQSEDCLYLNVWTPAIDKKKRPVMIYVHGGTLISGSGGNDLYSGENMAKSGDIVFVNLNYRLGIFGGLSHPNLTDPTTGMSGNWHAQDVLAAVKWVKNNIDNFGGDPDNITLFGESAGSWLTTSLITSPMINGFVNRAISQSGALALRSTEVAAKATERLFRISDLGCETIEISCLQSLDAKALHEMQTPPDLRNFLLVEDGLLFPNDLKTQLLSGEAADIDLIIGDNSDEIPSEIVFLAALLLSKDIPVSHSNYMDLLERALNLGTDTAGNLRIEQVYNDYRKKYGRFTGPTKIVSLILNDLVFFNQVESYARLYESAGGNVRKYKFGIKPKLQGILDLNLGAFHGSELPAVLGNLDFELNLQPILPKTAGLHKDKAMLRASKSIQKYWLDFARGESLMTSETPWFQYFSETNQQIVFEKNSIKNQEVDSDAYRSWKSIDFEFLVTDAIPLLDPNYRYRDQNP